MTGTGAEVTTAHADQIAAAAGDVARIVAGAAEDKGAAVRSDVPMADAGPFIRQLIDGARKAGDRLRPCRHLSNEGPQPTWLLGWEPSSLFCSRCAHAEAVRINSTAEDNACDVCRRASPTPLWTMGAATGALIVLYGACDACHDVETVSGREDQQR